MSKHAPLAPSSAHRWSVCHGSVELCARIPDVPSPYAREGSLAHLVAEKCLTEDKDAASYLNRSFEVDGESLTVNQEMVDHVNDYADFVRSLVTMWGGTLLIETKVKFTSRIYGTADVILLSEDGTTLHVCDLKYGQGKMVAASGNRQALCYVGGALEQLGDDAVLVKNIVVHIYQPRAGGEPWREWELTREEFHEQSRALIAAEAAIYGGSRQLVAGDHCTFCKAAPTCPERAKEANEVAGDVFAQRAPPPVETLSTEQLVRIVSLAPRVEEWLKAVHDFAKQKLERGEPVPGYKLVDKIGNRRWKDPDDVSALLAMEGIDPFGKPPLITPAEAERRLAKANRKVSLGSLVERPVTGQAMVPDSDSRPASDARAVFPTE